jgi:predicted DNA-binding transcriptional regulator
MSKDQWYGVLILIAAVVGLVVYVWLLFGFPLIVLQVTALIAVGGILVIVAWIGYTMATTPPPAPLDLEAPEMPGAAAGSSQESEKRSE